MTVLRCLRSVLLLCALALSGLAQANFDLLEDDRPPALGGAEGLLLVGVDTDLALPAMRIEREDGIGATLVRDLAEGVTTRLYRVKAGRYVVQHLSVVGTGTLQYRLGDAESRFEVKPGVINYPGDLRVRALTGTLASIRFVDHSLRAMDWLRAERPHDFAAFAFAYGGHYDDPFPAVYREALAAHAQADGAALTPVPEAPGALGMLDALWRPSRLQRVALNGAGTLVAEMVRENDRNAIDLIELDSSRATRLTSLEAPVAYLAWLDDRRLLLGLGRDSNRYTLVVLDLHGGTAPLKAEQWRVPRPGRIVRLLPHKPGQALFSFDLRSGPTCVIALDLTSAAAVSKAGYGPDACLNRGSDREGYWFADETGTLRAAVTRRHGSTVLLHGEPGNYRIAFDYAKTDGFAPLALSPDGNLVYGLTESGRGQRDLVVFDPIRGQVTQTLFSRPGVDTESYVPDADGKAIGATYYRNGVLVSEYFDAPAQRLGALVDAAFPGQSVVVLDRDVQGAHLLLGVEGGARPLALYHLDTAQHRAELLDESMPWLTPESLAATHTLRTQAADGTAVEAYLSLPPAPARPPYATVVMAHGGPLGFRDVAGFDAEVQLLASFGYAVLRVNFRGSDGFGKAFRDAGRGQFGDEIEGDIDAALQQAWRDYPLDRARQCALGFSYGGYSALISAIRWPERFRCVVSVAGVSDRLLAFNASDSTADAAGRKRMEEIHGDPARHGDVLRRRSPLYRVDALRVPVMLVHGVDDVRVDPEQSHRLARLLALEGRPAVLIDLPGTAHEPFHDKDRARVWGAIAGFLKQHLEH